MALFSRPVSWRSRYGRHLFGWIKRRSEQCVAVFYSALEKQHDFQGEIFSLSGIPGSTFAVAGIFENGLQNLQVSGAKNAIFKSADMRVAPASREHIGLAVTGLRAGRSVMCNDASKQNPTSSGSSFGSYGTRAPQP